MLTAVGPPVGYAVTGIILSTTEGADEVHYVLLVGSDATAVLNSRSGPGVVWWRLYITVAATP